MTDKLNREFVVKVQVPVFSNDPNAEALIYNEDRTFETFWPMEPILAKLMKGSLKKFFLAELTPSRKLMFIQQVPDPGW